MSVLSKESTVKIIIHRYLQLYYLIGYFYAPSIAIPDVRPEVDKNSWREIVHGFLSVTHLIS